MSTLAQRDDAAFGRVVASVREHTHALLALTIGYTDEEWAGDSRLPGWTRSHVAAHLVGGARGMLRICQGLHAGRDAQLYLSDREKANDIEKGSLASGIELQVALDESAGALDDCLTSLQGDQRRVNLRHGYRIEAQDLPLARLHELVIHSFDMRVDAEQLGISGEVAVLLLEFLAHRVDDRPDLPAVCIASDEGFEATLGAPGEPVRVEGPSADLVMWLARGVVSPRLRGNLPHIRTRI